MTSKTSTGNCSTGNWSISHYSTGHFSTVDYSCFGAFNKPCSVENWNKAVKPNFLYFDLTTWVEESEMSDKEKKENLTHKTTGGYLKAYGYQEAFRRSWDDLTDEQKLVQYGQLKALPNYDSEIFKKISGFDPAELMGETSLSGKTVSLTIEGKTYEAVIK